MKHYFWSIRLRRKENLILGSYVDNNKLILDYQNSNYLELKTKDRY